MGWESRDHGGRPKLARCLDVETSWETVTVWVFNEKEQRMELLDGSQRVCRILNMYTVLSC